MQIRSPVLIVMLLAACASHTQVVSPEAAAQTRRVIVEWLECEECREGQLQAVVGLGQSAVPSLAASLLQGPSPATLQELRTHLTERYRAQVEYARTHPEARPPGSEEWFVEQYTGNFVSMYHTRAAIALGRIGGRNAERALEEAQARVQREDVRAVVAAALDSLRT